MNFNFSSSENYEELYRCHFDGSSDSDNDFSSDGGKSEFDEEYYANLPPPMKICFDQVPLTNCDIPCDKKTNLPSSVKFNSNAELDNNNVPFYIPIPLYSVVAASKPKSKITSSNSIGTTGGNTVVKQDVGKKGKKKGKQDKKEVQVQNEVKEENSVSASSKVKTDNNCPSKFLQSTKAVSKPLQKESKICSSNITVSCNNTAVKQVVAQKEKSGKQDKKDVQVQNKVKEGKDSQSTSSKDKTTNNGPNKPLNSNKAVSKSLQNISKACSSNTTVSSKAAVLQVVTQKEKKSKQNKKKVQVQNEIKEEKNSQNSSCKVKTTKNCPNKPLNATNAVSKPLQEILKPCSSNTTVFSNTAMLQVEKEKKKKKRNRGKKKVELQSEIKQEENSEADFCKVKTSKSCRLKVFKEDATNFADSNIFETLKGENSDEEEVLEPETDLREREKVNTDEINFENIKIEDFNDSKNFSQQASILISKKQEVGTLNKQNELEINLLETKNIADLQESTNSETAPKKKKKKKKTKVNSSADPQYSSNQCEIKFNKIFDRRFNKLMDDYLKNYSSTKSTSEDFQILPDSSYKYKITVKDWDNNFVNHHIKIINHCNRFNDLKQQHSKKDRALKNDFKPKDEKKEEIINTIFEDLCEKGCFEGVKNFSQDSKRTEDISLNQEKVPEANYVEDKQIKDLQININSDTAPKKKKKKPKKKLSDPRTSNGLKLNDESDNCKSSNVEDLKNYNLAESSGVKTSFDNVINNFNKIKISKNCQLKLDKSFDPIGAARNSSIDQELQNQAKEEREANLKKFIHEAMSSDIFSNNLNEAGTSFNKQEECEINILVNKQMVDLQENIDSEIGPKKRRKRSKKKSSNDSVNPTNGKQESIDSEFNKFMKIVMESNKTFEKVAREKSASFLSKLRKKPKEPL